MSLIEGLFAYNGLCDDRLMRLGGFRSWPNCRREAKLRLPTRPLITGHGAFYGCHHFLGVDANYVTIVREPVAWAVSFYNFVRRSGIGAGHTLEKQAFSLSLVDFAKHPKVRNLQSRMIAGLFHFRALGLSRYCHDISSPSRLAIRNLRRNFAAYGTVETMDATLDRIAKALALRTPPNAERSNVAPRRPDELHTNVRTQLENILSEDMKLWEWATSNPCDQRLQSC